MRNLILFTFVIILSKILNGQINLPDPNNSNLKLSEFQQDYITLKAQTDSSYYQEKKMADRWIYDVMGRLKISNDSVYSTTEYTEAFKEMVESDLFCNNSDLSKWESIGPRNVGQQNGWVSAVYMHPTNPNEILLGARIAGIFKSVDGGVTWNCVTDAMDVPVLGVRQIVASPFDPDYLLAITGTESGLDAIQTGYLFSEDGGDNWEVGPATNIPDQLQWIHFMTEPINQGKVYAVSDEGLWFSNDNGQTWLPMTLPSDLPESDDYTKYRKLHKVVVRGSTIILTNNGDDATAGLWRGEVSDWIVIWELNMINSMTVFDEEYIIEPGIDNYSGFMSYTASPYTHISDNMKLDHRDGFGCSYVTYNPAGNSNFTGFWGALQTEGWTKELIGTVDKYTCENTGQHFVEAVVFRYNVIDEILMDPINRAIKLDCVIPAGARLKVCYSNYRWLPSGVNYTSNVPWALCEIEQYNYQDLFENVIYQSTFSNSVQSINIFENFYLAPEQLENLNWSGKFFYFVLEFNSDYISGEKFVLNRFGITMFEDPGNFVNVSNIVGDRYVVHVRGAQKSAFYRTMDGGSSFQLLNAMDPLVKSSRYKDELLTSINDPDIYYNASLHMPTWYHAISNPSGLPMSNQSGHHDDYRSSYITSVAGADYILWGNDGGIAKVEQANITQLVSSLNGDLAINMIYNLDVHEKTNEVIIGLQDNGTRKFFPNQPGSSVNGGDGCIAMIRHENSGQYVLGDPQWTGLSALKDYPDVAPPLGIVNNLVDITGGTYLGMRLEEYRFDDSKFITGLQRETGSFVGKIILNEAPDVSTKIIIPESWKIGAIAICDRQPNTVYLADDVYHGSATSLKPIFKTTTGGETSNEWQGIDPMVTIFPGTQSAQTELFSMLAPWKHIAALAVDPNTPNLVYAGMAGIGEVNSVITSEYFRVLKSEDGALTFEDWSKGLPALPVNYLLTVESANHLIFCATDAGVYYRHDGMVQWECFSEDLPKTRITDLVYNYCSKELYASTYGRGVWRTPVNINAVGAFQEEITGVVTWDPTKDIRSDLVIKSGSVLTINSTVHVDADRKIIVEPGARLVVNGGTLTNDCGKFWSGIEVWGNSNLPQYAINQGTVTLMNDATIEYATTGIQPWKPNDWNSTGGIIRATNAHFLNNKRDIQFIEYQGFINGQPKPNASFFSNCTFITDNNYTEEFVNDHVTMYKVHGVRFIGCDFADQRDVPVFRKSRGIFSMDAKYKVYGRFTGGVATLHPYYDNTDYDIGTFTNLKGGIEALNSNSQNTITVDHCLFTDCFSGVRLSLVDNAIITRNKFDRTAAGDWFSYQFDIYTDKSAHYLIEGNEMTSQISGNQNIGVMIENSGIEDNEVYKNKMTGIHIGGLSLLRNKNDAFIGGGGTPEGLEFLCNENAGNNFRDQQVSGLYSNYYGEKITQGTSQEPAGNKFSVMGSISNDNIINELPANIDYNYSTPGFPESYPDNITGFVTRMGFAPDDECLTRFTYVYPGPGKPIINAGMLAQIEQQFNDYLIDYTTKKTIYQNLLENGDRQELHDAITNMTPATKVQVKSLLLSESPYLSESIIMELATKSPGTFPYSWLKDIVIANIEVAKNPDVMYFLENKPNPVPTGLVNQILAAFNTITTRGENQHELIWLNREKNRMANLMIKNAVQDSTGNNAQEYNEWVTKRGDFMCELQMADHHLARGEKVLCESRLVNIDGQISQLTLSGLKIELEFYRAFKAEMIELTNERGTLEGLDSISESVVRYYAENAIGYAQVQAQNLLCFFLNECKEIPVPQSGNPAMMINTASYNEIIKEDKGFKIFPNPASQSVTIEFHESWNNPMVHIIDISGREMLLKQYDSGTAKIDVSLYNPGIYNVIIYENDVIVGREPLIIQK